MQFVLVFIHFLYIYALYMTLFKFKIRTCSAPVFSRSGLFLYKDNKSSGLDVMPWTDKITSCTSLPCFIKVFYSYITLVSPHVSVHVCFYLCFCYFVCMSVFFRCFMNSLPCCYSKWILCDELHIFQLQKIFVPFAFAHIDLYTACERGPGSLHPTQG